MKKPTLLFSEENDTLLSWKLLEKKDINVILLRFLQSQFFSEQYINKTKSMLTFVLDKKADINDEVKRFKLFLKKHNCKIDYFYNTSEFNQIPVQNFAYQLGLNGSLNSEQALWVKDKPNMKEKIREIGYKTVNYSVLNTQQDVIDFAKNNGGFPIVVKWRAGMSSIDVYKVDSVEDLKKLNLDYSTGKYMVEEYCPHPVWGVDALVQNGKVIKTFIILLPFDTNLSFTDDRKMFAQVTLTKKPKEFNFDDIKLTQDLVTGIGLKDGYISFEAFINTNGNPIIGELAWRPTGEYVLLNNGEVFGIDVYSLLLDVVVGRKIKGVAEEGNKCVGDMFLPVKDGKVLYITPFEELAKMKGVITGDIRYKVGDILVSKRKYNDIAGWVQVCGKNRSEVLKRMLNIYKKFELKTEA